MTPAYYKSGNLEVIDIIDAFDLNFELGNVIKYVIRAGRKNTDNYTDDLLKARYYIEREISRYAIEETGRLLCSGQ